MAEYAETTEEIILVLNKKKADKELLKRANDFRRYEENLTKWREKMPSISIELNEKEPGYIIGGKNMTISGCHLYYWKNFITDEDVLLRTLLEEKEIEERVAAIIKEQKNTMMNKARKSMNFLVMAILKDVKSIADFLIKKMEGSPE